MTCIIDELPLTYLLTKAFKTEVATESSGKSILKTKLEITCTKAVWPGQRILHSRTLL